MRQFLKITSLFALALVFTAGMAFGQDVNEATVDQGGSGSDADITQNVNGADNSSFDANVRQRGGSQTVTIKQLDSNPNDPGGSGIADVIQLGADGGNEALVDQNRTRGAEAFLKQVGANNEATAAQGAGDVLRGYDGTNTSRGSERALQVGIENTLEVFQSRDPDDFTSLGESFNMARVTQDGNYNNAFIEQNGNGNEANLLQDGGLNEAQIQQLFPSNSNIADVQQLGVSNKAYTFQNSGSGGSFKSKVEILQDGDTNFANTRQLNGADTNPNTIDIDQLNNNNFADVVQDGPGHSATITQTGGQSN
ncbi:MAG: hypothetical protein V5A20_13005 [Salinibacter sp.]|uniref:hypothetical protein n=1 Tax=Salinibacter sp. TaxID=2065818 RepID=UPI002FC31F24